MPAIFHGLQSVDSASRTLKLRDLPPSQGYLVAPFLPTPMPLEARLGLDWTLEWRPKGGKMADGGRPRAVGFVVEGGAKQRHIK